MTWWRKRDSTLQLWVHVQPGAKRTEVVGLHGERLKLRIAAPPADGKANQEIRRFLAEAFAVPVAQVSIQAGTSSRAKQIDIDRAGPEPEWFVRLVATSRI